jgi:hypothetical protein
MVCYSGGCIATSSGKAIEAVEAEQTTEAQDFSPCGIPTLEE